jgi:prenyltransferase beta subunit
MKICSKCKLKRHNRDFYKHKSCKFKISSICKDCNSKICKKYRKKNRTKLLSLSRKNWLKNKKIYNKHRKIYRKKHKDLISQQKRKFYLKNKKKILKNNRIYYQKNKKSIMKKAKKYMRLRRKISLKVRILDSLRSRLYTAIKKYKKSAATTKIVGCSIEFLKAYLQAKFKQGMSWKNYGKWHIDHIRPCASFDLSKSSEQRKCFHYTNLQPLWAKDNLRKR